MAWKLIEILNRYLHVEERLESFQVVLLHDDDYLVYAGIKRFLDNQQDSWLGNPIPVNNREQLLFGRFRSREEPRSEAGCRDDGLAHLLASAQCQGEARHLQITLDDFNYCLLISLASRDELCCSVTL